MKIILSRKGIDGGNCKASNLVMCDNQGNSEMIMIPIPSPSDKTSYKNIKLSKNYDFYVKNHLKNHGIDLASYCHLDPYLINYFPDANILGSFGQVGIAQGHLEKQKVQVGDLFIFFGKFDIQKISVRNVETVMKNQHILFGYLQINEIIYSNRLTEQERNDYEKNIHGYRHIHIGIRQNTKNTKIIVFILQKTDVHSMKIFKVMVFLSLIKT